MHTPFRDLTLSQPPNLPLLVAIGTSLLSLVGFIFLPLGIVFGLIAFGSWFTWSWLEIFEGINWFRRTLGSVVMAVLIVAGLLGIYVLTGL